MDVCDNKDELTLTTTPRSETGQSERQGREYKEDKRDGEIMRGQETITMDNTVC